MFLRALLLSSAFLVACTAADAKSGDTQFLPDGRALVSEKDGALWLLDKSGQKLGEISGVPSVTARGQGGFGDIYVPADFETSGEIYISYVERDSNDNRFSGAVVDRATLNLTQTGGSLSARSQVWEQSPKMTGNGHYGHRVRLCVLIVMVLFLKITHLPNKAG